MNSLNNFNQRFAAGRATRGSTAGGTYVSPAVNTFNLPLNDSGPSLVSTTLNINGTPVLADLFYTADDANLTDWTGTRGPTLSLTGSGDDPTFRDGYFLDNTGAVKFNSGRFYEEPSTMAGTLDADFVVAWVSVNNKRASDSTAVIDKRSSTATAGEGWFIRYVSSTYWFVMGDGTTYSYVSLSTPNEGFNVLVVTCDVDEATEAYRLRSYVNGVLQTSTQGPSVGPVGLATNPHPLRLGRAGIIDDLSFVGAWKGADLFSGGAANVTEMDRIAKELTYKITGVYPATAAGNPIASVATRSSTAYCPIVNSDGYVKYHPTGVNWPRVGSMLEADGTTITRGFLSEPQRAQTLANSNDLTAVAWVTELASVSLAGVEGPILDEPVHLLSSTVGDGLHVVEQTGFATGGVCSVMVKQHPDATQNEVRIAIDTNRLVSLNFSTGTVASSATVDDGGAIRLGDGWWWLWARRATGAVRLGIRTGPFVGFDEAGTTPQVYIQAPQREAANDIPSTYIRNSASSGTVTRVTDLLEFNAENNVTPACTLLADSFSVNNLGIGFKWFLLANDGTIDNRIGIFMTTGGVSRYVVASNGDQTQQSGTTKLTDGTTRTIRGYFSNEDSRMFINGVQEGSVITRPSPLNLTTIAVGSAHQGLLSKASIYNKPLLPGEQGSGSD